MSARIEPRCKRAEELNGYVLRALAPAEAVRLDAHLENCVECRNELEALQAVVESFVSWPTNVLRPPPASSLWERIAGRVTEDTGGDPLPSPTHKWAEPEWEEAAPGIWCKLLATDTERSRVSMLVRLGPGVDYPPHRHAGVEELHLLEGELWINDDKLYPGDYSRAEPGTADKRVWSETGCTCVLITSSRDVLG
jgi:anti-sigma factor ChrR (cupin superfamily)